MTLVLHTADTHLGYEQYNKPERREDFMDAFRQVIDAAIEYNVDAVVHAGDLLNRSDVWPGINIAILRELDRLDDHDIPFLTVLGNHDRANRGEWIDLFAEARSNVQRLGTDPVIINETAFYGLDYAGTVRRQSLDYTFSPSDDPAVTQRLLVAHGLFDPPSPYGDWDLHDILFEANLSFDGVLLGDDHTPRITTIDHGAGDKQTVVTYPGSTERTAADQRAPRRYNLIEIGDGSHLESIELAEIHQYDSIRIGEHLLDTRPFRYVDIEVGSDTDLDEVTSTIKKRVTDPTDAVVIVTLDGSADGPPMRTSAIEEFAEESLGAFYASARDKRDTTVDRPDTDVSFADPDEAVREHVEDMDVSPITRELESEIRSEAIAKSNLRQKTTERLRNALEEDPEALLTPDEVTSDEESADTGTAADAAVTDDEDAAPSDSDGDGSDESQTAHPDQPASAEADNPTLGDY